MVYYRVVDVVCAEEVFKGPGPLLWSGFHIVGFHPGEVYRLRGVGAGGEIPVDAMHHGPPGYHRRRHDCYKEKSRFDIKLLRAWSSVARCCDDDVGELGTGKLLPVRIQKRRFPDASNSSTTTTMEDATPSITKPCRDRQP